MAKKQGMGKGKSIIALLLSVCVIGVLAYTAVFGLRIGDYLFPSVFDEQYGVRKGLDLVGGSSITYEAQVDGTMDDTELANQMVVAQSMLQERLDNQGYSEATIQKSGDKRLIVEIPSVSNPEEAVKQIGSTAKVVFLNGDDEQFMDGTAIANAQGVYGQPTANAENQWYIAIELTDEGAQLFGQTTQTYLGQDGKNHIAIKMDDETLLDANFSEVLSTKNISISGSYDEESAKRVGDLIAAGSLPFELKDVELRSVGPTLGDRALSTCLRAAGIGLLLVMLFMILFYRLPGFITSVILFGYVAVVGLIMSTLKLNLSLPGIAGIILSIGMAVDANVVIFERVNEELRNGKSLKGAIQAGFGRAFSAILDSNVTTIIASLVLYQFGTGTVKGFAVTLFIGIVVSMFCAVVVCHFAMNMMANLNISNQVLYCSPTREEKEHKFNFVEKRKPLFIIAAVIICIGIVSSVARGYNLGIDFTGGTTMQINMGTEITQDVQDRISSAVEGVIGEKPGSIITTGANGQEVIVKTKELDTDTRNSVYDAIKTEFSLTDESPMSTDNVTATVGGELRNSAITATVLAAILMLIYISLRFQFLTAVAAVFSLIHDMLIIMTVMTLFQIPMNTTFIAAILTILGYSINATIVVFDRVRENRKLMHNSKFKDVINVSIWQTMGRSINTTLTTLFVIVALCILGVASIREFAIPIIVGIVAGAYSSVCLSGNFWNWLEEIKRKRGLKSAPKKAGSKKKATASEAPQV